MSKSKKPSKPATTFRAEGYSSRYECTPHYQAGPFATREQAEAAVLVFVQRGALRAFVVEVVS